MTIEESVDEIAAAPTWEARILLIRRLPEQYGTAHHQDMYAEVAARVYVPRLAPDFAYVHWREECEMDCMLCTKASAGAWALATIGLVVTYGVLAVGVWESTAIPFGHGGRLALVALRAALDPVRR